MPESDGLLLVLTVALFGLAGWRAVQFRRSGAQAAVDPDRARRWRSGCLILFLLGLANLGSLLEASTDAPWTAAVPWVRTAAWVVILVLAVRLWQAHRRRHRAGGPG